MSNLFKKLLVTLGNDLGETFTLEYQVRTTESAQIWANCIHRAEALELRETHRLYNFPKQDRSETDYLLNQLDELVLTLRSLHPELNMPLVDRHDIQNSINNLHFNFAHSHHVTQKINHSNRKVWSDFNIALHAIEGTFPNLKYLQTTGLNCARVVFTWKDSQKTPIPDQCYQDFIMGYEFGCAYTEYSQVGRHFYEMFCSQDDQLADEHILPSRLISADTSLWFGPTSGHAWVQGLTLKMQDWFEQRKARFNRLGYFWNDPKLALGHIPVARLSHSLHSVHEIRDFVSHLSRFDQVVSVQVS